MEKEEAKILSLELMETAEAVYLNTIDKDGFPNTRALFNLRNKEQYPGLVELFQKHRDDLLIYFSTNTSSRKVQQIRANPAVSVFYCNPKKFHGLMLAGKIEIVADPEIKKALWQEGWEKYYPNGVDDPDFTILRLSPIFARGWYQFGPFEFTLKEKK